MSTYRLADRLSAARQQRFVGRAAERSFFESVLSSSQLPFNILHIFGPGGVGKSTLLREYQSMCQQASIPAYYIDARNVEPSPEPFIEALRHRMGLNPPENPWQALEARGGLHVILIDTYEILQPLDGWLREVYLPQMPENVLIVLAGHYPPSAAWRSDPGWQTLIRTLPLRNLSPEESRDYLTRREIPHEQHQEVLTFTHGHPLALSLVADVFAQRHDLNFQPAAEPDVIKNLLERLVQKVPGPAHRTALEACALVRLTTEPLLAEILQIPDAHELFEWLRSLSFIESVRQGLFPHDLAREALAADLRWRNPDWYNELHNRARLYYANRLQQTRGQEQQRVIIDYIYLHRENPMLRPFFTFFPAHDSGSVLTDIMRDSDVPTILGMVRQHEGEESARLANLWISRQPQGVLVFRDAMQQPVGFMQVVVLNQATPEELNEDPATRIAWNFIQTQVPLRLGESAAHFRFWMASDTYQEFSYIQSLIGINVIRHYLTTPGLAYTFFPCADPDAWELILAYADLERNPAVDYTIGSKTYGVYGHNWRLTPPVAWLALLAERELAITPQVTAQPKPTTPLVVLSEEGFASAVRDALRDYTRPDALRNNPLLQSKLVMEKAGNNGGLVERIPVLRGLIKEAAELLQNSPRDSKLYRVLHHTYLYPAPTQEQAAELLDLPFSTFRRHLKAGVTRITEIIWQWELQGLAS